MRTNHCHYHLVWTVTLFVVFAAAKNNNSHSQDVNNGKRYHHLFLKQFQQEPKQHHHHYYEQQRCNPFIIFGNNNNNNKATRGKEKKVGGGGGGGIVTTAFVPLRLIWRGGGGRDGKRQRKSHPHCRQQQSSSSSSGGVSSSSSNGEKNNTEETTNVNRTTTSSSSSQQMKSVSVSATTGDDNDNDNNLSSSSSSTVVLFKEAKDNKNGDNSNTPQQQSSSSSSLLQKNIVSIMNENNGGTKKDLVMEGNRVDDVTKMTTMATTPSSTATTIPTALPLLQNLDGGITSDEVNSATLSTASNTILPNDDDKNEQALPKNELDPSKNNEEEEEEEKDKNEKQQKQQQQQQNQCTLHTYKDPIHNKTFCGLDVSLNKFRSWVHYTLLTSTTTATSTSTLSNHEKTTTTTTTTHTPPRPSYSSSPSLFDSKYITTTKINKNLSDKTRRYLRTLWFERRLISEGTEILAVYKSDQEEEENENDIPNKNNNDNDNNKQKETQEKKKEKQKKKKKRGGFTDLLSTYGNRLAGIIEDEYEDEMQIISAAATRTTTSETIAQQQQQQQLQQQWQQDVKQPEQQQQKGIIASLLSIQQQQQQQQQQQKNDNEFSTSSLHDFNNNISNVGGSLESWLNMEYGQNNTNMLHIATFSTLKEEKQIETLQTFLDWFRTNFPYYYDKCGTCGASVKDDPPPPPPLASLSNNNEAAVNVDDDNGDETRRKENALSSSPSGVCQPTATRFISGSNPEDGFKKEGEILEGSNTMENHQQQQQQLQQEDENKDDGSTFMGYVYPTDKELQGKASRTEVYQCHVCQSFTRFPRYNRASSVVQNKRGRCGEYSMLLFRLLRVMGHKVRWVIDWADHVWVEVWCGGRWVHLDPCEAAVDNPLLYESWGKKQTYIIAFYAPRRKVFLGRYGDGEDDNEEEVYDYSRLAFIDMDRPIAGHCTKPKEEEEESNNDAHSSSLSSSDNKYIQVKGGLPLIEDVTLVYTSDCVADVNKRREESHELVKSTISKVQDELWRTLQFLQPQNSTD